MTQASKSRRRESSGSIWVQAPPCCSVSVVGVSPSSEAFQPFNARCQMDRIGSSTPAAGVAQQATPESPRMTPDQYLDQRVADQIAWYDRRSRANQRAFHGLRSIEVVAAASIAALAGHANSDNYLP